MIQSASATEGHTSQDGHEHGSENGLRIFVLACICAGAAYLVALLFPHLGVWPYAVGALIAVFPFAWTALKKALAGRPFSIETLMSIAVVGAIPIDAGAEAVVVVVLFSLGELLEGFAAARARSGLTALAQLLPTEATIEVNSERQTVSAASLTVGTLMLVAPGERLAADGTITDGRSDLNESAITGESSAIDKTVGDPVFAGSINGDGQLKVTVTKDASHSVVARISDLVEQAQASSAPSARFIDNFSAYYTPAAMVIAAIIAVAPPVLVGGAWPTWIYRALTVLLIACPCALVLSTPAAIATGIATAARYGILIKSGAALEMLAKIRIAAFDKTGTLTRGHPVVTDVDGDPAVVLLLAAAVETGLSHPVARGIVAEALARGLAVPAANLVSIRQGEGVEGTVDGVKVALLSPRASPSLSPEVSSRIEALEMEGKTIAVLFADTRYVGVIASRDEQRSDAKPAIAALAELGVRTLMLSGDNQRTASAVAGSLGMSAEGELMPADKLARIEALKAEAPILMVGDGVNDAPALATASLGLAMGGGTDVAIETADVGLLRDRLLGVPDSIRLARQTRRTILINIALSVGLKLIFLVLAIFGITNLWTAIIADTGATILVTINALLLFWTFKPASETEATIAAQQP